MAHHGCINGTLSGASYSSPVPVIGLYIAAASLLCMLLMIYDIIAGFCARKRWFPCKLFTLNSVTLTLFSIAAKLPVDLTTSMPSPQDQLSKLSGTSIICISMGFLYLSLGVSSKSECYTNMAALTIFVITLIVNVCIQISTGVIVLFIPQHIVVLCCMFLLLMMFWVCASDINDRKRIDMDYNKGIITKGDGSMFHRLKRSYVFGFRTNPQLLLSIHPGSIFVATICSVCSVILIHAAFGSLVFKKFKFCSGNSDYGWSMPMIIVVQVLTVAVGCFGIVLRSVTLFKYIDVDLMNNFGHKYEDIVRRNVERSAILVTVSPLEKYRKSLRTLFIYTVGTMVLLTIFPVVIIPALYHSSNKVRLREWIGRKSEEDINRMIKHNKIVSPIHLSEILSRTHPSQDLNSMEIKDEAYPDQEGVKVSSLSIVFLIRIAQVSLRGNRCKSMAEAFAQTNEIIYFTEKTLNPKTVENDIKLIYAKAAWAGPDFSCILEKYLKGRDESQSDIDRANEILENLLSVEINGPVFPELSAILCFIRRKTYSSIEDLGASLEQIFIDMLLMLLAPLPNAIYKILSDSPAEEYEDTVKVALKILCKVESIDALIPWSFPAGCNISRLTAEPDEATV